MKPPAPYQSPRPGGHPGHRVAEVRSYEGDLLAAIDSDQAAELLRRGLIVSRGRRHYQATDAAAVHLWARSRSGGSSTTVGPDDARQWHRALRGAIA